jgi:hypothetical protein
MAYKSPPRAYEHVSYWLVFCGAGCGAWLSGQANDWSSSKDRVYAAPFADQDKAWQAAMAAGWVNVPLPDHEPHPISWWQCNGNGTGDCSKVRSYKNATVCPACRASGWMP